MVKRRSQPFCGRSKRCVLCMGLPAAVSLMALVWGNSTVIAQFDPGSVRNKLQIETAMAVEATQERAIAANSSHLCNIFTYLDNAGSGRPDRIELFRSLIIESWRRHSHRLCHEPVLLHDLNVRIYVPDMPDEYFKLPYPSAKSDMLRYGVLYHHGGIYMDADLLAMKDLDDVIQLAAEKELVSFLDQNTPHKKCSEHFSSDFLGGYKGSPFLQEVWEKQKSALTKHCPNSKKTIKNQEALCCYDGDEPCSIPWNQLGEGIAHSVTPSSADSLHCFSGDKSFAPAGFLDSLEKFTSDKGKAEKHMKKFGAGHIMERTMYHTFNEILQWQWLTCKHFRDRTTILGELFAKSFETGRGKRPSDLKPTTLLFQKQHPEFTALAHLTNQVPCWWSSKGRHYSSEDLPRGEEEVTEKPTEAPKLCKIFTLWEYKDAPLYARLNVESWRRHTRNLCEEPILVNSKNVMKWIPDMPKEYFRFPYHAATSDLIRYGLLYHHGGIYMDADFIVLRDLTPVIQRLEDHDLISYATQSNPGGVCSDSFSSNFIAGRKGSIFMQKMWEKQKAMITKHCPLSDKTKEIVCCFDDPNVECHVPFAGIGEGTSHPMLNELLKQKVEMKTYCFADEESFVPDHFAYVLEHVSDLKEAQTYMEKRGIQKGLDRMAFHMFNSIIPLKNYNCEKLFTKGTTVGHLYLTAFSTGHGKEPKPKSNEAEAFLSEHQDFAEFQASNQGGWPCKTAHKGAPPISDLVGDSQTPGGKPTPLSTQPVVNVGVIEVAKTGSTACKIFTWWEYDGLGPLVMRVNVQSWRRRAPQCSEPVVLTVANVREHVPDVPEEFFRLPYPEARADSIRWGAIYHNGGIFLEPDVLMAGDITPILEKLDSYDLISSQEDPGQEDCTDQFNPAIIAGPKGSPYFKEVWRQHRDKMTKHCALALKEKEIICCFDDVKEKCHVPWLSMNRGIAHPIIREWSRKENSKLKSFCFNRGDGFQPNQLQDVVRERWDLARAETFWEKRGIQRPMQRILYHFQSHGTHVQEMHCSQLFNASTAVGAMYARAFSGEANKSTRTDSKETAKFLKDNPYMKTVSHVFQDGLPCKSSGPPALPTIPPNFGGKKSCRIFTLWEYPHAGPPVFKLLNIESWRRHTHGLCQEPVLINDQNVKSWIPDMPDEYFRMPTPAPKSDLIRYALLYHHGGLYMDADFIAVKDMDPIVALLETHDFISYQMEGEPEQACSSAFSSNLIGGRKGSPVHKFIWERQKEQMKVRCGEKGSSSQACCPENVKRQCSVPWASLGEGVSHPAFNDLLKTGDIYETFCFADEWTFVPDHFAYSVEHIPSKDEALKYMTDKGVKKPLDRIVYHLFNAITPLKNWKCAALLDPRRLMGHLYTESFRSVNGRTPVPESEESRAWLQAHPEFIKYQKVYNGWQPCQGPVEIAPSSEDQGQDEGCKIFTLWEYKTGPPLSVALNVEGWRRHSKGLCTPVLINDQNVLSYLPDMPKEYFRMPYSQAKSDIIRYGLLYHHGGIYMDTDFLVVKDLDEILNLTRSFDLVSYVDESTGGLEKGSCSKHFSSNFMASRKGSAFMKAVWERQKMKMVQHCPLSQKTMEKVCCFDDENEKCHIPWAGIGEGVSHEVFSELDGEGIHLKSYCFADERGFTPPDMITILDKSAKFATEAWKKMDKKTSKDPWGRIMYHTFNSIMPWSGYNCKQIFNESSVYGRLNRLSYTTGSGPKSLPATEEYLEWLKKYKMKRFSEKSDSLPCK